MTFGGLVLLERQYFVQLSRVVDLLELLCVTLNLLLQVLDSLSHILCYLQVMLDSLHGSAGLGLFESVGSERLMSVHELVDLFLLQLYLGHLTVVVGQFLIIIVVCRLLITLKFVDRLLFLRLWSIGSRLSWWLLLSWRLILLLCQLLQVIELFRTKVEFLQV